MEHTVDTFKVHSWTWGEWPQDYRYEEDLKPFYHYEWDEHTSYVRIRAHPHPDMHSFQVGYSAKFDLVNRAVWAHNVDDWR